MLERLTTTGLLMLALAAVACGSTSNEPPPGAGGSKGSGGTGGSMGKAGTGPDGGVDAAAGTGGAGGSGATGGSNATAAITQCATMKTPQAVSDCIINLPTDAGAQTVTFDAGGVQYSVCKM